jgi:hypothetical protein
VHQSFVFGPPEKILPPFLNIYLFILNLIMYFIKYYI